MIREEEEIYGYNDPYDNYEDYWDVSGKTAKEIFDETISNSKVILSHSSEFNQQTKKNLLVMLYGHTIAATESYLASTFIEIVFQNKTLLKKLIKNDPNLKKKTFNNEELLKEQDSPNIWIKTYLRDLIFHNIRKVKPLYESVLGVDFGNVEWLCKAVIIRHHCVHRAGYDKDGNKVNINQSSIEELFVNTSNLIKLIEENKNNNLT